MTLQFNQPTVAKRSQKGVSETPKIADVTYEQPLTLTF